MVLLISRGPADDVAAACRGAAKATYPLGFDLGISVGSYLLGTVGQITHSYDAMLLVPGVALSAPAFVFCALVMPQHCRITGSCGAVRCRFSIPAFLGTMRHDRRQAPVAQCIEQRAPKHCAGVRVAPGAVDWTPV